MFFNSCIAPHPAAVVEIRPRIENQLEDEGAVASPFARHFVQSTCRQERWDKGKKSQQRKKKQYIRGQRGQEDETNEAAQEEETKKKKRNTRERKTTRGKREIPHQVSRVLTVLTRDVHAVSSFVRFVFECGVRWRHCCTLSFKCARVHCASLSNCSSRPHVSR